MKVIYTAAHGGFASEHEPLGGGAAVYDMLTTEWANTKPFDLALVTPHSVSGHDIVGFDTASYARFSRQFQSASTDAIRRHDPADTVVLTNDISEGPDFRTLNAAGYRCATVWHVDVVAYIAAIYCRELLSPEALAALHRRIGKLYPNLLRLIFQKQADCLQYSAAHIVPSAAMKNIILRCYPKTHPESVHVLPWGAPPTLPSVDKLEARAALGIPDDALVLLTVSRLSPEKNQQLLLDAIATWENDPDFPKRPLFVLICGGAAYMHGKRQEALLRARAGRLRRAHVVFAGHVQGPEKQKYFSAADLYVFPSRHESYGLTLMEAFQYGLPALTLDHAGARAVMQPGFGAIATKATFLPQLRRLVQTDLVGQGRAARTYAQQHPFASAAAELAAILTRL